MNRPTVLIFGISSMVGSNLAEQLRRDFRVIGTYYRHRVEIPGVLTLPCDVLNRDSVQMIMYTFRPQFTIYAAGISSLHLAENKRKLAEAINTGGVFNVTSFSERYKSKFCYLSSAYLFSGEQAAFREIDNPSPNTFYGKTMASAEFYIQKSCLNYIILRCSSLYGRGVNPLRVPFFERMERKFFLNETFTCDNKIYLGHLDIAYVADVLRRSFKENVTNRLFQVASKNLCTYFEFARIYARVFGASESTVLQGTWPFPIDEMSISDFVNIEGVYHYQLDVANVEASFGIEMPTVEESLEKTFERFGGKKGRISRKSKSTGVSYI